MVESCSAQYVSLNVRVSNKAALHLYRDTLGFTMEKVESKYYADSEDAYSMKMDLSFIKDALDAAEEEEEEGTYGVDEGDEVGDAGKKEGGGKKKEKMRKVKVGRGLGVGDLVERNESKA